MSYTQMVAPERERQTYTIPEAAQLLGISRNGAYQAAERGELQIIKIGKRLLVPRPFLDKMLAGGRSPAA